MSNTKPEFTRSDAAGQHRKGGQAEGIRTTGAVSPLLAAVASDAARIARRAAPVGSAIPSLIKLALITAVVSSLLLAVAILWALYYVPHQQWARFDTSSLMIETANGEPLGRVGPIGDAVRRQDIPAVLVNAVLSIEDRRFYRHWGIDLRSIVRAMYANWSAGGIVEGGSTITQQLAKIQLVGNERSLDRKVREALTAVWLDFRLGKDEILTRYLNSVYLGSGAYGISAAARLYFDNSLSDLTLSEAALLAGLIQAPSRYDPTRNPEAAHRRAGVVIDAMLEAGVIDASMARKAKDQPAKLKLSPKTAMAGSWFADWIARHEFPKVAGIMQRIMRVRTTLQPQLQRLAERAVQDVLAQTGEARGASQAALVAMRPDGAVVAMVGGRNYNESQFNRAVDALRQPGSTFKLFVYYAALRNGYSPDDTIDASPVEIGRWRPENYGGQQYGHMTLSQAFAYSINSAAVRLAMTVGLDKVVEAAQELGLDAPLARLPSMALGAHEVSLLDLTRAFASVRAGRPKLEPWGIAAFGPENAALRSLGAPSQPAGALPQRHEVTRLLHAVVDHGTGRDAALDYGSVAGKTGTSQDYRDAWFVGFNEELVVGVWVGNDDRTPMERVTGGSLPAQIWKRFVSAATPILERSPRPFTAEVAASPSPAPARQAMCDMSACAAAYQSFRPSDCTYQPYVGPRRLCEKGTSPRARTADARELTSSADDDFPAPRVSRPQGAMNLGGRYPRRESAPPARRVEPFDPFGPEFLRRLDRMPW